MDFNLIFMVYLFKLSKMKKKTVLSENDLKNIIISYKEDAIGVEGLAIKFGVGKLRIKEILSDGGIPIKKRGAQSTTGNSSELEKSRVSKYVSTDKDKELVAVCKLTGKKFSDVNNLSGALTEHIRLNYGDVPIPSNTYQRKKYEKENNKKWFEEYFDVKSIDVESVKKCRMCDWVTNDIHNKSGCFEVHIKKTHNMDIATYLGLYKEDATHHKKYDKISKKSNVNEYVKCKICNKKMGYITSTHISKHKMTMDKYKIKYPDSDILSKNYRDKLKSYYKTGLGKYEAKFSTKPQNEIYEFIKSFGVSVKKNDKKVLGGVEIDVLLPDKKIGIEYNGLYYHRESMGKGRQYHLNKTKLMNAAGYGLIHIFEDEWISNEELVKNKIKHILCVNDSESIGGRKCKIKRIIETDSKSRFLIDNHIQSDDKSTICYGAYFKDDLVAVMCFTNKRNMNNKGVCDSSVYELTRYATDSRYRVVGVAKKLINTFIDEYNPDVIISFGDRRWVIDGNNNLYTKLGFKLVKTYGPDYRYYNSRVSRNKRLHKFGFGKSSLKKKYPHLDFSKTEKQLMTELGYDRIWDCGLFKYELVIKKSDS